MNQPLMIFDQLVERRNFQLSHYDDVDSSIFHQSVTLESAKTWSSEAIFRHILMGMNWMAKLFDPEASPHSLALVTGSEIDESVPLEAVKQALDEQTQNLRQLIAEAPDEFWTKQQKTFYGTSQSGFQRLMSLMFHEAEHIGELKWIFKRLTGYSDNQMYRISD